MPKRMNALREKWGHAQGKFEANEGRVSSNFLGAFSAFNNHFDTGSKSSYVMYHPCTIRDESIS